MTKKKLTGFGAVFAGIVAAIVASRGGAPKPAPHVPPAPQVYALGVHLFDGDPAKDEKIPGATLTLQERTERTDGAGNAAFVNLTAGTYEVCAAAEGFVHGCATAPVPGPDVNLELARDVPPVQRVRVDGRFWVTSDGAIFRPRFTSVLVMPRDAALRATILDQAAGLGFNGIRTFVGRLAWAGQSAADAEAALPDLLTDAAARGLYVYATVVTDSKDGGYDIEAHARAIAQTCAAALNCLLEGVNEIGHETQSAEANDPARMLALFRRVVPADVPWALGSSARVDEAIDGQYPGAGGAFVDAHLDRGRDLYNQVRRLREIAGLSETFRVPAMSGEPIGIAEIPMPGKQRIWGDDAARFSFAMGVLCRGFELGCVFHSEDGLHGHLLGPNTQAAAVAFMDGTKALDTTERLAFQNAGWPGSPVMKADFDRGVVRAYSFVAGNRGWTVLLGLRGDPAVQWGGGWHQARVAEERPGIRVLEIGR
jgi:hypothetical protein